MSKGASQARDESMSFFDPKVEDDIGTGLLEGEYRPPPITADDLDFGEEEEDDELATSRARRDRRKAKEADDAEGEEEGDLEEDDDLDSKKASGEDGDGDEDEDDEGEGEDSEEVAELRRRLEERDARDAERDAAVAEELKQLREWRENREALDYEDQVKAHGEKTKEIMGRLREARTENDVDKEMQLIDELSDHKAAKPKKPEPRRQSESQSQGSGQARDPMPQEAQDFMGVNPWIGDSRFPELNQALQQIDIELQGKGFRMNQKRYYSRLVRQLQKRFPRQARIIQHLEVEDDGSRRESPANRQGMRSSGGGKKGKRTVRRDPKTGRRVFSKKDLTAEDVRIMREFEMDPTDDAQAASYLRAAQD